MKALVITNVEHEGPGTLGEFLDEKGVAQEVLRLYAGDAVPDDPGSADLVVVMGGPMNVYEDDRHPFLREETEFIGRAMQRGTPVLGICLGAQLIARACGARVYRAPVKEVGWRQVTLTGAGERDRLFRGSSPELPVLQWHEDTFDVPSGGELLATAPECPNQAFRVGSAWGLQFHVEADETLLETWFGGSDLRDEVLRGYGDLREDFLDGGRRIFTNLLDLAGAGKARAAPGRPSLTI